MLLTLRQHGSHGGAGAFRAIHPDSHPSVKGTQFAAGLGSTKASAAGSVQRRAENARHDERIAALAPAYISRLKSSLDNRWSSSVAAGHLTRWGLKMTVLSRIVFFKEQNSITSLR